MVGDLIHHSARMQRQFVFGVVSGTGNTLAETLSKLQLASSRVRCGEATFRSGEFSGLKLTPEEWAPVEAAVREEVARVSRENGGVGRPLGCVKSCLKGVFHPKEKADSDVLRGRSGAHCF